MKKMTFQAVFGAIEEGKYTVQQTGISERWNVNHVVDANKSISWNREQVKLHNDAVKQKCLTYFKTLVEKSDEFKADISEAISYEYKFNKKQATAIVNHIDCSNLWEAALTIENTCEIIKDFLKY